MEEMRRWVACCSGEASELRGIEEAQALTEGEALRSIIETEWWRVYGMEFFLFTVFSFLAGACWSSTLKIGRETVHSFMPVSVWQQRPEVFFITRSLFTAPIFSAVATVGMGIVLKWRMEERSVEAETLGESERGV
jgi:hypothetical protein